MADKCISCNVNTKKTKSSYRERRMLSGEAYIWHRSYLAEVCKIQNVSEASFLCGKCRVKLSKLKQQGTPATTDADENMSIEQNDGEDDTTNDCVTLSASQAPKTHAYCIICKADVKAGLFKVIPTEARFDLLIRFNVYADSGSRVCTSHLTGNHLSASVQCSANTEEANIVLTSDQATGIIEGFLSIMRERENTFALDFNDPSFTDDVCLTWTGWTRCQFQSMLDCLQTTIDSCQRDRSTALLIFWVKLKTGLSFQQIASLMNKNTDSGIKMVSRAFRAVTADLDAHFAPSYITCNHISRDKAFSEHMTAYSSVLYGGKLCIIWDGTYYYIEKSSNYALGRQTYSGQKHRPLVKFMSLVFPDGYVLDSIGPYLADGKNNDAGITQHILSLHGDLTEWLAEGDVCVVDRGFRDVLDVFEDLGLETKMPAYLQKGLSQHTAKEANESRLVTKVRWVVEAYHGRVKKWLFFDKVIHHDFLDIIGPLNRILTAAINAFRPPLISTDASDAEMAREMLRKAEVTRNALFSKVEKGPFSSRGKWAALDSEEAVPEFPVLSKVQLEMITFGTYQLKQAKSYTKEHLSEDGEYKIDVHHLAPGLLRVRIQSRHINAKQYFCWIEYSAENTNEQIVAWFCHCKAGQRTVGCCAHVASVIWYLGYARHQEHRKPLKARTNNIMNAAHR